MQKPWTISMRNFGELMKIHALKSFYDYFQDFFLFHFIFISVIYKHYGNVTFYWERYF